MNKDAETESGHQRDPAGMDSDVDRLSEPEQLAAPETQLNCGALALACMAALYPTMRYGPGVLHLWLRDGTANNITLWGAFALFVAGLLLARLGMKQESSSRPLAWLAFLAGMLITLGLVLPAIADL